MSPRRIKHISAKTSPTLSPTWAQQEANGVCQDSAIPSQSVAMLATGWSAVASVSPFEIRIKIFLLASSTGSSDGSYNLCPTLLLGVHFQFASN